MALFQQSLIVEGTGPRVEPPAFTDREYDTRLAALRRRMAAAGVEAFVSFTPENIYYLTGHDTPGYYFYQACVITMTAAPVNVLRRIEASNTLLRSWSRCAVPYADHEDPVAMTVALLDELGVSSGAIGIEAESFFVTPLRFEALRVGVERRGGQVVPAQMIEPLRAVKSDEELNYIRLGARVVERAMDAAIDASYEGATENEVAAAVWSAIAVSGGEYAGLPPFITSGPRSSLCHATWAGRRFEPGDLLAYELPGVVKRYVAPLFRCGTIGPAPDDIRMLTEACTTALESVIAAIRPGVASGEVHAVCRTAFERAGVADLHGHRTAYSVGINYPPDWGEGQVMSIGHGDRRPLEAGMVFHLVPGLFRPRQYLIEVSETVLVTRDGCECITDFPRDLFQA